MEVSTDRPTAANTVTNHCRFIMNLSVSRHHARAGAGHPVEEHEGCQRAALRLTLEMPTFCDRRGSERGWPGRPRVAAMSRGATRRGQYERLGAAGLAPRRVELADDREH